MISEKSGEFRGKTVEAAIGAGLAALKLSRDEVEIEVVKPGSRGVLGIGAEDAVVRLTSLQPAKPEPKPIVPREGDVAPRRRTVPTEASKRQAAPDDTPRQRPAAPEQPKAEARSATDVVADKAVAAAEKGREILTGLLERMGLRADVEILAHSAADDSDDTPVLNIVGEDLGVLIGRQNETLSALEFLTRLAVNQQTRGRTSFSVDVNGYRAKRAESLHKLALRMADQATQSGRTVALEPMPPAERRIVHIALRDHPTVTTQSVGEGDRRKVTIIPRKG